MKILEGMLVSVFALIIAQFRGRLHEFFASVGDRLNDKIEATGTQLDDAAKVEFAAALKESFIPQLEVDGVDGAPGAVA